MPYPPDRGRALLARRPMVHGGFLKSWTAGGLKDKVLSAVARAVQQCRQDLDFSSIVTVLVTGQQAASTALHVFSECSNKWQLLLCMLRACLPESPYLMRASLLFQAAPWLCMLCECAQTGACQVQTVITHDQFVQIPSPMRSIAHVLLCCVDLGTLTEALLCSMRRALTWRRLGNHCCL